MNNLVYKGLIPSEMSFLPEERAAIFTISTAVIDRDHEIILPEGIDTTEYMKNPVVLWSHDSRSLPIGTCTSIIKTAYGLIGKIKFANTPEADKIYQYLKDGGSLGASIGFSPVEYQDVDEEINGVKVCRRYTKISLLEWSLVSVPANQEALLMAVKNAKESNNEEVVEKIWDDEPNEIRYRIRDPKLFEQDSFRTIPIKRDSPKINAIAGKLNGESKRTLQSLRFPKDEGWDMGKAKDWVAAHPDIKKEYEAAELLEEIPKYDENDAIQILTLVSGDSALLEKLYQSQPEVIKKLKQMLTKEDVVNTQYQKLVNSIEDLMDLIRKSL